MPDESMIVTIVIPLLLFPIIAFLFIAILNLLFALRLDRCPIIDLQKLPRVSVLIPARNEEENLKHLLLSLLQSKVQPHEILVLDDQSTDRTHEVAQEILSKCDIPFAILKGISWTIESGMTGKNHACQQLADQAKGEVLLFCDADVTASPDAIRNTLSTLITQKCSGVTGIPKQIYHGIPESQAIPWAIQFPILFTLPLRWSWRTSIPSLQMANGQWLAIWKNAYQKMGGHRALGLEILEDVELARRMPRHQLPGILPAIATNDVEVSMYKSWNELVEGFSKNLILIWGGKMSAFIPILFFIDILGSFPIWGLAISKSAALASLILIYILRVIAFTVFRTPSSGLLSHFRSLIRFNELAFAVIRRQSPEKLKWKGRSLSPE